MDAVSAFEALDGSIFQGRLLHLLPGKVTKAVAREVDLTKATFKAARAQQRKANARDETSWSTFYMRDDTVAEAISDLLGIPKAELLDPEAPDAAVRMALGETQVPLWHTHETEIPTDRSTCLLGSIRNAFTSTASIIAMHASGLMAVLLNILPKPAFTQSTHAALFRT